MTTDPRIRNGTVNFDIRDLLHTANEPLVWQGQKYLLSAPACEACDEKIYETSYGTYVLLDAVWSQPVTGGPMTLQLIIVLEVVPPGREVTLPPNTQSLIRTFAILGRSLPENLQAIKLLEASERYLDSPEREAMKASSKNEYDSLNDHNPSDVFLNHYEVVPWKKKGQTRKEGDENQSKEPLQGSRKRQRLSQEGEKGELS